jgi:hypothetical protein
VIKTIDEKKLREKLHGLFYFEYGKTFGTYPNHADEVNALVDKIIEASTVVESEEKKVE